MLKSFLIEIPRYKHNIMLTDPFIYPLSMFYSIVMSNVDRVYMTTLTHYHNNDVVKDVHSRQRLLLSI